jgi:hypothetical protein
MLWNAIPFSFLTDYSVTVSDFLDQFGRDALLLDIRDESFGYSITGTSSVTTTGVHGGEAHGLPDIHAGVVTRNYFRTPCPVPKIGVDEVLGVQWDRLRLKPWTLGKQLNTLSLLVANIIKG